MPIITFTSDYGLTDYRVAAVKGALYSLQRDCTVVDISHQISAYNLLQTSFVIRQTYPYFPKGSIHLIAVDSFFHPDRKNLLFQCDGHYFLCADNGLFSLIFSHITPDAVYEITYNNRFDDVVEFPAADVLAPAAVHLQKGGLPEMIGRPVKTYRELSLPKAGQRDRMLFGEIIYVDNFGNLVSNISKKLFESMLSSHERYTIKFRNLSMVKVYQDYAEMIPNWEDEPQYHGRSAALFNYAGLLELSIYKGNLKNGARSLFGLGVGENIYVEFE